MAINRVLWQALIGWRPAPTDLAANGLQAQWQRRHIAFHCLRQGRRLRAACQHHQLRLGQLLAHFVLQ